MASRPGTAQISSLTEAVATLVGDGDSVALEGFTHLIPFAAGHELIRQGRRELELVRMMPDLLYGQMIGMGTARRLVLTKPHPEVQTGQAREATGRDLRVAEEPPSTEPPSGAELEALRELVSR